MRAERAEGHAEKSHQRANQHEGRAMSAIIQGGEGREGREGR